MVAHGELIDHRYKVVGGPQHGGFGAVWQAIDEQTHASVAIKLLQAKWTSNRKIVKRFRNEYRVLRALRHPHIIEVLELLELDSTYAIVMPYLSGGSLHDRIDGDTRRSWLPLTTVEQLASHLLSALVCTEEERIVHRDIKPDNVLFADMSFDHPLLTDFGLAHLPDHLLASSRPTTSPQQMGTLLYMSPEQLNGEDLDIRSDLYSLGMTLYKSLTGRLFFDESLGAMDVQSAIFRPSRVPPREYRSEIPSWLDDLVRSMISFESYNRPQHAGDALDIIDRNVGRTRGGK